MYKNVPVVIGTTTKGWPLVAVIHFEKVVPDEHTQWGGKEQFETSWAVKFIYYTEKVVLLSAQGYEAIESAINQQKSVRTFITLQEWRDFHASMILKKNLP